MTTRTRKREIAVVYDPTYELLTLTMPMLPSINRKFGYSSVTRRPYVNAWYQELEDEAIEDLEKQVMVSGWTVSKQDRYLIITDLFYYLSPKAKESPSDLHNPWKPMVDCLAKAHVLYNDKYERQEVLTKCFTNTPLDPMATIEVYKFTHPYQNIPIRELIRSYLHEQHYTQSERKTA